MHVFVFFVYRVTTLAELINARRQELCGVRGVGVVTFLTAVIQDLVPVFSIEFLLIMAPEAEPLGLIEKQALAEPGMR